LPYESLSRIGENGERMYDADGDTGINVFAISIKDWGEWGEDVRC